MTTKDEALKMAIEVLCLVEEYDDNGVNVAKKAIQACKEALEPQIELADTISVEDYQKLREQPTNMVTIPLDKLEDMQRRLKEPVFKEGMRVVAKKTAGFHAGAHGVIKSIELRIWVLRDGASSLVYYDTSELEIEEVK